MSVSPNQAAHRRATFIADVGAALLSSTLNLEAMLERVARLAVESVADWCAIDVPSEAFATVVHAEPEKLPLVRELRRQYAPRGVPRVLNSGQAELYAEVTDTALQERARDATHLSLTRQVAMKSLMIVPMQARGSTIGTITLASSRVDHLYGSDDLEMAKQVGQITALAVESARLFRRERQARALVERSAERMSRLQMLTADLAKTLTSKEVAQVVIDHSAVGVGAVTAVIWAIEPGTDHAHLLGAWNMSDEASLRYARIELDGHAPLADAIRSRHAVFIASAREYEERYPISAERITRMHLPLPTATACLPLVVNEVVIGAIAYSLRSDGRLGADERAFLTVTAGHCAQSLHRAQIYEAEQRSSLEKALLYELVDTAARAESIDEVYERALSTVEQVLEVGRSAFLLLDDHGALRTRAWHDLSDAYRAAIEERYPWALHTQTAAPIVISDVESDDVLAELLPTFRQEGIAALALVPLVHQQRGLGVLLIHAAKPRTFSSADLALARSVAAQVAQKVARRATEAENRRLFAQAQEARAEAEAASRMKDEFLAVVSHELRTPMSAILGWSQILKTARRNDPAALSKGLDVIERNARAQTKIIEDILDVSRVITGKLVLEPVVLSLAAVVADAVDAVRPAASAKGIALGTSAPADACITTGDPGRLRQVIWNLLSNAVKFTPHGGRVDVALERGQEAARVVVRDTGKGIAAEFLPHVFERFRQADSSTTRLHGGLGLGLAIVRHLVELHGGSVHAASDGAERGSTFTVSLPLRTQSAIARAERGSAARLPAVASALAVDDKLRGVRVLVVDDEWDACEMLNAALSGYGAQVLTVDSAQAALDALAQHDPHVIVSDIGLPGQDGYELMRRVREQAASAERLRAIALTAYARPEDRARALSVGYDEHVSKPVEPSALADLIASMLTLRLH